MYLDIFVRGSFTHKTMMECRELLDRILENTSFVRCETVQEIEYTPEEPYTVEFSSKPREPKDEEIQPSQFQFQFEGDLFEDYGNTSNYSTKKRPPIPRSWNEPLEENFLKEMVHELSTIMSEEWLREAELSFKIIQIAPRP